MTAEERLRSADLAAFTVPDLPDGGASNGKPHVDLDAAEQAAADLLTALGIPVDSEELRDTPGRMARAYAELFESRPLRLTTFPNEEGYDELVVARDIPFRTTCWSVACSRAARALFSRPSTRA